ncbi:hypothetical protein BC828DRAFT_277349 [Blastocladiella britannica]|nr:hypothetical protein BC828DRAFT_277349 [Blastocladiella britannica]
MSVNSTMKYGVRFVPARLPLTCSQFSVERQHDRPGRRKSRQACPCACPSAGRVGWPAPSGTPIPDPAGPPPPRRRASTCLRLESEWQRPPRHQHRRPPPWIRTWPRDGAAPSHAESCLRMWIQRSRAAHSGQWSRHHHQGCHRPQSTFRHHCRLRFRAWDRTRIPASHPAAPGTAKCA